MAEYEEALMVLEQTRKIEDIDKIMLEKIDSSINRIKNRS
jgi:hypothetical protein